MFLKELYLSLSDALEIIQGTAVLSQDNKKWALVRINFQMAN